MGKKLCVIGRNIEESKEHSGEVCGERGVAPTFTDRRSLCVKYSLLALIMALVMTPVGEWVT